MPNNVSYAVLQEYNGYSLNELEQALVDAQKIYNYFCESVRHNDTVKQYLEAERGKAEVRVHTLRYAIKLGRQSPIFFEDLEC